MFLNYKRGCPLSPYIFVADYPECTRYDMQMSHESKARLLILRIYFSALEGAIGLLHANICVLITVQSSRSQ